MLLRLFLISKNCRKLPYMNALRIGFYHSFIYSFLCLLRILVAVLAQIDVKPCIRHLVTSKVVAVVTFLCLRLLEKFSFHSYHFLLPALNLVFYVFKPYVFAERDEGFRKDYKLISFGRQIISSI